MNTATVATGSSPVSVTVDPTDRYVYVANNGSNSISQYTISTDGSLIAMNTATVATMLNPRAIITIAK